MAAPSGSNDADRGGRLFTADDEFLAEDAVNNTSVTVLGAPPIAPEYDIKVFLANEKIASLSAPVAINTYFLHLLAFNVLLKTKSGGRAASGVLKSLKTGVPKTLDLDNDMVSGPHLSGRALSQNPDLTAAGINDQHVSAYTEFVLNNQLENVMRIARELVAASRKSTLKSQALNSFGEVTGMKVAPMYAEYFHWIAKGCAHNIEKSFAESAAKKDSFFVYHTSLTSTASLVLQAHGAMKGPLSGLISDRQAEAARDWAARPWDKSFAGSLTARTIAIAYAWYGANEQPFATARPGGDREVWYQGYKAAQAMGSSVVDGWRTLFASYLKKTGNKQAVENAATAHEAAIIVAASIGKDDAPANDDE